MTGKTYEYAATVDKVVDGDTVHLVLTQTYELDIDFGFNIIDHIAFQKTAHQDIRLYGINAPEMHGATAAAGLAAKNELIRLLGLGTLRVVIIKQDKYGRWLGSIYVTPPDGAEVNVNQAMIDGGFAIVYV